MADDPSTTVDEIYHSIAEAAADVLEVFCQKLHERELISGEDSAYASSKPLGSASETFRSKQYTASVYLIGSIKKKVKYDSGLFENFLSVLRDIPSLSVFADRLKGVSDCQGGLVSQSQMPLRQASDWLKDVDSALGTSIADGTSYVTEDELESAGVPGSQNSGSDIEAHDPDDSFMSDVNTNLVAGQRAPLAESSSSGNRSELSISTPLSRLSLMCNKEFIDVTDAMTRLCIDNAKHMSDLASTRAELMENERLIATLCNRLKQEQDDKAVLQAELDKLLGDKGDLESRVTALEEAKKESDKEHSEILKKYEKLEKRLDDEVSGNKPTDKFVMELGSLSHTEEPPSPPPPNTDEPPPPPNTDEPPPPPNAEEPPPPPNTDEPPPPPPPNADEPPPPPNTNEPPPASSPMATSEKSRQESSLPEHSPIVVDPPHHASTNSPISISTSCSSVIHIRGSENILTVSVNINTVDASTQTSSTSPSRSCACAEVSSDIKKLMAMLIELQDEVSTHGMDLHVYEIRQRTESINRKVESVITQPTNSVPANHPVHSNIPSEPQSSPDSVPPPAPELSETSTSSAPPPPPAPVPPTPPPPATTTTTNTRFPPTIELVRLRNESASRRNFETGSYMYHLLQG